MSAILAAGAAAKVAGAAMEHGLKMLADLPKGDSLVGYAQLGNVEPSVLVDEDLRNSDMLPDTLQLAQSIYAAYYLRAFSMHNISIGNANVASRLDKFSTRRSPGAGLISAASGLYAAATEEYDERLVIDGDVRELPFEIRELEEELKKDLEAINKMATGVGLEGEDGSFRVKGQQPVGKGTPNPFITTTEEALLAAKASAKDALRNTGSASSSVSKINTVDISDPVNLGVGRFFNVTIKENGQEVTVPIHIRLNAMYMATAPLLHVIAAGSEDISLGARFKKWRLGGIDFWRDLVCCQDLIDAHKGNAKADKTGIYLQMMQKRRNNTLAAAVSGSLSANNSSNILVLSQASAEALEMKIFGKLKDFNTRQKLFQQGYAMLMFVVNKPWGTVRMYTRDIPEYTELHDRDIKATNKNGGVDIGDVLTAFRAGSTPRL